MRSLTIFVLLTLVGCDDKPTKPASLGNPVDDQQEISVQPGERGAILMSWWLPDDHKTASITFRAAVPWGGAYGEEWIGDVYNYTGRPAHDRPMKSDVQRTLDLCWIEVDGETVSDGVIPDTDGMMTFGLSGPQSNTDLVLKCDISEDPVTPRMGIFAYKGEAFSFHAPTKPEDWSGTIYAESYMNFVFVE